MLDMALLTGTELFAELDEASLGRIASAAVVRELRRGDVLFREGDEPDQLFVVDSGRIAIANRSPDGRETASTSDGA